MHSLRRFLLIAVVAFLPALLFATAFSTGVLRVASHPESIKKVLSDSGIYGSVVGEVLKDAETSSSNASEVSLTNPTVKKAAESAFNPQLVQSSTENFIDGTYRWLNGATPLPDFKVDLSHAKATFAAKVGDSAEKRASSLPACKTGVLPSSYDPFSARCLPRGITPAQVGAQAESDILKGEGFLEDPIITADTIKDDNSGKSIFAGQLKNAPASYQKFKAVPTVLTFLTLLTIAGIILLSSSKFKGLRRVGIIFLIVGGFIVISSWALNQSLTHRTPREIKLDNKVLQNNARELLTDTAQVANKGYLTIGTIYIVIGVLTASGAMLLNRGGKKPEVNATAENVDIEATSSAKTSAPNDKASAKPKKHSKIQ